jgi:hypothetical protein
VRSLMLRISVWVDAVIASTAAETWRFMTTNLPARAQAGEPGDDVSDAPDRWYHAGLRGWVGSRTYVRSGRIGSSPLRPENSVGGPCHHGPGDLVG